VVHVDQDPFFHPNIHDVDIPKSHFCHLVCFVSVVLYKSWGSRGEERLLVKRNIFSPLSLPLLCGSHQADGHSTCKTTDIREVAAGAQLVTYDPNA